MKEIKEKPFSKSKIGAFTVDHFKNDITLLELGINEDHNYQYMSKKRSWWIVADKNWKGSGDFKIFCCRNNGIGMEKEIRYLDLTDDEKFAIMEYIKHSKLNTEEKHFDGIEKYPTMRPCNYTANYLTSTKKWPKLDNYLPESWFQPIPDWAK